MISKTIFTEGIQRTFEWLIDSGFEYREVDTNVYFNRTLNDEDFGIGFSWSEYNEILINGISAYKGFQKVEKIIHRVTGNSLTYTIKHHWGGPVPQGFEEVKSQEYFSNAFFISNPSQLNQFSELVKEFLENDAKSFFQKYSTLKSIIDEMEKLPSDQKAHMIVNTNNTALLRIMAIKYFVDPIEGVEFYNQTIKELEPLKSQNTFSKILENLHKAKSILTA